MLESLDGGKLELVCTAAYRFPGRMSIGLHGGGHGLGRRMTPVAFAVLDSCARNSGGAVMCVRLNPPNGNMGVDSGGNATHRAQRLETRCGGGTSGGPTLQRHRGPVPGRPWPGTT